MLMTSCRACVGLLVWVGAVAPVCAQNELHNSLGMALVRVPAGVFWMGQERPLAELQADFPGLEDQRLTALVDERPRHRVRISRAFYLGRHEVTVGQFRRFVAQSGHVPESVADGTGGYGYRAGYVAPPGQRKDAFAGRDPQYSWQNPGFAQSDEHPVVNVSWHDAQAMAAWLSRTEGRRYRLPTEAEWEYACLAGSQGYWGHGDDRLALARHANVFDAEAAPLWPQWTAQALPASDGQAFTAPVGRYRPNAFGLYDMSGNVWEWVADWHQDDYYAQSPEVDPPGPAEGSVRVRRGGSWHTWALYTRCSYRNWNAPSTRYTLVGFRLLMEAPEAR